MRGTENGSTLAAAATRSEPRPKRGDEAEALLRRWCEHGDREARAAAVEHFLPLVRAMALRYAGRIVPLEDIVQVGTVGLIKAVDRFDSRRGVAFTTYAVPVIIGEIKRYFRDCSWSIHVPRPVQELSVRIAPASEKLTMALGRTPSAAELSEALEVDTERLADAISARTSYQAASLARPPSGEDGELEVGDALGGDDPGYAHLDARMIVLDAMRLLDPREQRVVLLTYVRGLTQVQIAAEIGCSQMHVSRILHRALDKLHDALATPTEQAC